MALRRPKKKGGGAKKKKNASVPAFKPSEQEEEDGTINEDGEVLAFGTRFFNFLTQSIIYAV